VQPKIVTLKEKKLVGIHSEMLVHQHEKILKLWRSFMPRKQEVKNSLNHELIALQDYISFGDFSKPYNIWAAVEVLDFLNVPIEMERFIIPEGTYAVFLHKGMNASLTYNKIMSEWLPNSGYIIDNRPHFQIMGDKYLNGSPDSEEDFYIPIKSI
tara:strand:- start:576 stop:1040 length:465 start_codon:yes stop_codon:yes gene_type:complete